jgi:hypothetical protein
MAGCSNLSRAGRALASLGLALGALAASAWPAAGAMRSKVIAPHLCKTVHGGRFVPVPGFPGEKIDRRLLPDIRWMKHRFDIFITDGYSDDPVHAGNGEHPIGLATDIVPNAAKGGTWNDVGELAHFAEPVQNQPVPPWRWVGWNGDAGHGRGNHLHLSWMHSPTPPDNPARTVYTRRCPGPYQPPTGGHHHNHHRHRHGVNGGTGANGHHHRGGGSSTGGTSPGKLQHRRSRRSNGGVSAAGIGKLAPIVRERH